MKNIQIINITFFNILPISSNFHHPNRDTDLLTTLPPPALTKLTLKQQPFYIGFATLTYFVMYKLINTQGLSYEF